MKDFYELDRDIFEHCIEYDEMQCFPKGIKDARIRNNLAMLVENQYSDIWKIMPFNGVEKLEKKYMGASKNIDYPDIIYAAGNLDTLANTDYPIVKGSNLLIISKRFLDVLLAIKQFDFTAIPVTIYDGLETDPFLKNGELKSFVKRRTDFLYIKLLNLIAIDRENSEYHSGKHRISRYGISKLSLIIPDDGLDPIFRMRQCPEPVLITKEACKTAKKQGIKGVRLFGFPDAFSDNIEDFFHDYYKDNEE
jgi:hypothetical protein